MGTVLDTEPGQTETALKYRGVRQTNIVRGVCGSALKLRQYWEGQTWIARVDNRTREIRPSGMERGACGNVSYGGTRNPPHIPKGCGAETLCL